MSTPSAAILLSRQPLRPCGRCDWVRQVQRAVRTARDNQVRLLTSVGLQTWELIAATAALELTPQRLYLPEHGSRSEKQWCSTLGLDPARDRIQLVPNESISGGRSAFMAARDRLIAESADILYPVSIRPGGSMEHLVEKARRQGKRIAENFLAPYCGRTTPLKYDIPSHLLNPALAAIGEKYLIHWTRTSNRAWPDERLIDYYGAILESEDYPRSAHDTLLRIITTKRLLASARHMPANIPTVSFTGLSPAACLPLMRWRARYSEMSFEPYGLGIAREAARELGIREVQYFDSARGEKRRDSECWLRQSVGTRADWTAEREYRARGDLDLSELRPDSMLAFCFYRNEAQKITALTGVRAVSILSV